MNAIAENIQQIRKRITKAALDCGRSPQEVGLVAVTKTVSPEKIRKAAETGLDCFGENYIQEAGKKIKDLSDTRISWHFIGHLQSNKAKYAVRLFDLIHSVDSLKLAKELNRQAARHGQVQKILIQVNLGGEQTKSGAEKQAAEELVYDVAGLENLSVRGLMTLPPFFDAPEKVRPYFRQLAELHREIGAKNIANVEMAELSMGMTGDFETAIEEGATLVRIGTAIFGGRS